MFKDHDKHFKIGNNLEKSGTVSKGFDMSKVVDLDDDENDEFMKMMASGKEQILMDIDSEEEEEEQEEEEDEGMESEVEEGDNQSEESAAEENGVDE